MLKTILSAGSLIVLIALLASAEEMPMLKTEQDKVNYALGVRFVRSLMQRGGTVNLDLVVQGMLDALNDERLLLSESEISMAGTVKAAGKGKSDNQPADLQNRKGGSAGKVMQVPNADPGSKAMARQVWSKPTLTIDQTARPYPSGSSTRAQDLIDRARAARAKKGWRNNSANDAGTMSK
jgi:hypothetical protein